ncbi:MAG: FmdB family zinc ribbon protein [Planctomycetota bacterium]|jgi:putative FmdB family regulatory protein
MPIYAYTCSKCEYRTEEISSVEDGRKRLESSCPECGAKLRRPFNANIPTVHLRGYSPAHPRFFRGMRGPRPKKGR